MREFLSDVVSNISNYGIVQLNHRTKVRTEEIVLGALGLKNLNQLRDRYEGVAFHENFNRKIMALCALEQYLEIELTEWKYIDPKDFQPTLDYLGLPIDVIISEYGHYPNIASKVKRPAVVMIQKDNKTVWVCGFAQKNVLKHFQDPKKFEGEMNKDKMTTFNGFDQLILFRTFDELKSLVQ